MLVVFVPTSFLQAPEERHIVSLLRSCMSFRLSFFYQHFAPNGAKAGWAVNLAPIGASPPS